MRYLILLLIFISGGRQLAGQAFPVEPLQVTGPDANRIVLVFMGDGYREEEMGTYRRDVSLVVEKLFEESPFREYRNYFNIYAIEVPSRESGADHPGTATDVTEPSHSVSQADTYFGSTFDYFNIHRLLVPTDNAQLYRVLLNQLPQYDQVMVVVNTPHYGGSGGSISTTSTNAQSAEIAIHELGHSFAFLADEYYAGDVYASERANMSRETNPGAVRWKNWIDEKGVGIYQHCCAGQSAQWYKPHQECKMQYLGYPFCPVCREAIIDRIYQLVSPIDSFFPAGPELVFPGDSLSFYVALQQPLEPTLESRWLLNGQSMETKKLQYNLQGDMLQKGENRLVFQVIDKTPQSRTYSFPQGYLFQVVWTIQADGTTTNAPSPGVDRLSYRVFPNPASDQLHIEYESSRPMPRLRLHFFDLQGRRLLSQSAALQSGRHTSSFDLRRLPAGVYTAVLELPGYRESFKVVIE